MLSEASKAPDVARVVPPQKTGAVTTDGRAAIATVQYEGTASQLGSGTLAALSGMGDDTHGSFMQKGTVVNGHWHVLLFAPAGFLLLNGVPHFMAGRAGRIFKSPFFRYTTPKVNIRWGLFNFLMATVIITVHLILATPTRGDVVAILAGGAVAIINFGLRAGSFFDDRTPEVSRRTHGAPQSPKAGGGSSGTGSSL